MVFTWRFLRNRIPTKVNIFGSGILQHNYQLCVVGCSEVELADHLFMECPLLSSVWHLIRNYIGISLAYSHCLLNQFDICGNAKSLWFVLYLIWVACVWLIKKTIWSLIIRMNHHNNSWIKLSSSLFGGWRQTPLLLLLVFTIGDLII